MEILTLSLKIPTEKRTLFMFLSNIPSLARGMGHELACLQEIEIYDADHGTLDGLDTIMKAANSSGSNRDFWIGQRDARRNWSRFSRPPFSYIRHVREFLVREEFFEGINTTSLWKLPIKLEP